MINFVFHHIGIACQDIQEEKLQYKQLGYVESSSLFTDKAQGIKGIFLEGAGPRVELVMNHEDSTTLTGVLARGNKIYHMAYTLEKAVSLEVLCKHFDAIPLQAPTFSDFFQKKICFIQLKNDQILEFVGVL